MDAIPPIKPDAAPPKGNWAKTTLWLGVFTIIALNLFLFLRTCTRLPGDAIDKTGRAIEKAGRVLADMAAAFNRGKITTEFISYATTLDTHHYLQFATLKQTELFSRTEEKFIGYIPLPEIVVEARAPVEFTYYLDLNARWDVTVKDGVVYVLAPAIKFNKPAVDASAISYEVRKGYIKTAEAQEALKQSITSLVTLRAKENIPLIREHGRKQTTEFVERWLLKSFTDGKNYSVKVFFPGEQLPEALTTGVTPKE